MSNQFDSPGAVSRNTSNSKTGKGNKQNYTEVGWSNDKGSVKLGHIHKQGDVTAGVLLGTPNGNHQLSLDIDGPREGWTTSTSPGNFTVECGDKNEEAEDSLCLTAKHGNIIITALDGKIRLQGTDIEIIATGEGDDKGNIKMEASESIITNSKKLMMSAKQYYRIATPGIGEVVANAVLQMYGSIFRGVSDGCYLKDSKVGGKAYAIAQAALATQTLGNNLSDGEV